MIGIKHAEPKHRLDTFPYKPPIQRELGTCACGCGDSIETGYAYIKWEDELFSDEFHLVRYMKTNCGLEEIG